MDTPSSLYAERRQRLLSALGRGMAIVPAGKESIRNADSHHRFRPSSDFYYLTGFAEPGSVLLLTPHHKEHRVVLFVPPRDPEKETWNGRRIGVQGAIEQLGADAAYPLEELPTRLAEYMEGTHELYYRLGYAPELDTQVIAAVKKLREAKRRLTPSPTHIIDLSIPLHALRLRKSPEELELMRRAASITTEAHCLAMAFTRPGRLEHEIEALLEFTFRARGAVGPAYPSIVGGGMNATILHYIENRDVLRAGDLLLIDAGAELGYYSADITRTFPVDGRFSPVQRDVYQIVLEAQQAAIEQVRPGVPFVRAHEVARSRLTEGLRTLGVLTGDLDALLESEAYKPYYMHRTGHWLGLDVHDAGDYVRSGEHTLLEPGMVVTVEPGLYFGEYIPEGAAAFKGIGIRIEDDVLVTDSGPEVLTRAAPKSIPELEAIVGSADGRDPLSFFSGAIHPH